MRVPSIPLIVAAALGCGSGAPARLPVDPALPWSPPAADEEPAADDPAAPRAATPIADAYRAEAAKILEVALADRGAYAKLAWLTDRIGARLSGSPQLEQAVAWAADTLSRDGHENVRKEKVMVPRWVRGEESAALIAPVEKRLSILALGGSPGTSRKGLIGEVVVVTSWDELEKLGDRVKGKIVFFDVRMTEPKAGESGFAQYGQYADYRGDGPARASKLGAAGALIRSLASYSLDTPHTGFTWFPEGTTPIPCAALSVEDAALIARLAAAGETVKVKLVLGAKTLGDVESANVVAELSGRELPHEIVVIACHLDSWDVGQGAHDDGAGCVAVMEALTVLRKAGLRPRRTIRVVLYTNEENGLRGAFGYAEQHKDELANHVAALEADVGGFRPLGFGVQGNEVAVAQVADLATLLAPLGDFQGVPGFGGADLIPLARAGVPAIGLIQESSRYFHYHHSEADTLDKVDPDDLQRNVAAIAVWAWVVAELPARLGTPMP